MKKKVQLLVIPIILILSTSIVFYVSSRFLGKGKGYLTGIVFYWLFWCLIVPIAYSRKSIIYFLTGSTPFLKRENWWVIILFSTIMIVPLFMYKTIPNLVAKPVGLILLGVPIGIISGTSEEVFWRGLYAKEFPNDIVWAIIVPSILFSLFHFAPQFAIPHHNRFLFVVSTFPLGIINGIVSYKTKSAKWSAIGHSIGAILAFGGPSALSLYELMS